jgi:hypothetical protein
MDVYASGQSSRAVNSVIKSSEVRIHPTSTTYGPIAQLVEHVIENHGVGSSNLPWSTNSLKQAPCKSCE